MKTHTAQLISVLLLLLLSGCITLAPRPRIDSREPTPGNISISLDNVEMDDVIGMFRRITDANIIATPSHLYGRCTADLNDMPWPTALEMILSVHNLRLRHASSNIYSIVPGEGFVQPAEDSGEAIVLGGWAQVCCAVILGAAVLVAFHLLRTFVQLMRRLLSHLLKVNYLPFLRRVLTHTTYIFLLLYYSIVAVAFIVFRVAGFYMYDDSGFALNILLPAAGLFAVVVIAFAVRKRLRGPLRPRTRLILWLILLLPAFILILDAPSEEPAYTIDDLAVDWPEADACDRLLSRLTANDSFDFSPGYMPWMLEVSATNALDHADTIDASWLAIAEGRDLVAQLNRFDRIAEQIRPEDVSWESPFPSYTAARTIAQTYQGHALLRCAQDNCHEAISELSELHSVALKIIPDSPSLVTMMIAVSIASRNIETAYAILNSTKCSEADLRAMQKAFPPLSQQNVSLRKPFIRENLFLTTTCKRDDIDDRFLQIFTSIFRMSETVGGWTEPKTNGLIVVYGTHGETSTTVSHVAPSRAVESSPTPTFPPPWPGFWTRSTGKALAFLFYDPNRTVRDLDKYTQSLITFHAGHWPADDMEEESLVSYSPQPDIRNLGGWLIANLCTASYTSCHKSVATLVVRSDLLAMTLAEKAGEYVILRDYINGGQYAKDHTTGEWFSKGPDGLRHTEDDIRLAWEF